MHRSLIVAGAVALSVAGCGLIPDNSLRYREAQVLEPITVPGDMVFIGADPLYAVPQMERRLQGKGEGEDKFEAPRPPPPAAADGALRICPRPRPCPAGGAPSAAPRRAGPRR